MRVTGCVVVVVVVVGVGVKGNYANLRISNAFVTAG
jgi:hypothetical protein